MTGANSEGDGPDFPEWNEEKYNKQMETWNTYHD